MGKYRRARQRHLNDYLDERDAQHTAKWEKYGGLTTVTDTEGTVWGLPRNANRVFYQSFIREDFLKSLGYTEEECLTTFEAFEQHLYAVKEADLYGNGETIPLIVRGRSIKTVPYAGRRVGDRP